MTEDEMKTKECPQRMTMIAKHCIASDCAMWELEYKEEKKEITRGSIIPEGWALTSLRADEGMVVIVKYVKSNRGDCGLKTKECECSYSG